jgi:cyclic pyranopterin phosphate synthase
MHAYMIPAADSPPVPRDLLGRSLESLRVSVTDRCNLRCSYCMPEEHYVWLPRPSILDYEEIVRIAAVFASLGVTKVRLTGGEPLLRQDLEALVGMLRRVGALCEIALTTNGILLGAHASALRDAGLDRVTVSLDTLRADRFERFARRARLQEVLEGIAAARSAGFSGTKVNTVVVRGVNDDELGDMIAFGRREQVEIRFIEYMDVGGATRWSPADVVSRTEILDRLAAQFGTPVALAGGAGPAAPAERFALPDGTAFGVIASTTAPFCRTCGRGRLTADGIWYTCLYQERGVDLKTPLRDGAPDAELAALVRDAWTVRADRGAELRLANIERGPLYAPASLKADPHREMHTRGG